MFKPYDRVIIVEGTEDGQDDHLIGKQGTVREVDDDYAEVEIDGEGSQTFQFGTYQLESITEELNEQDAVKMLHEWATDTADLDDLAKILSLVCLDGRVTVYDCDGRSDQHENGELRI